MHLGARRARRWSAQMPAGLGDLGPLQLRVTAEKGASLSAGPFAFPLDKLF
jgi:hypothetical protein